MFDMYIKSGLKMLRCGYTTGSCASGASKAAAFILMNKNTKIDNITITTPENVKINMDVIIEEIKDSKVICSVIKDSGDDPDITNGIKITAEVEKCTSKEKILIEGSEGVGKVVSDGLFAKKGEWAINPVPRKMIYDSVLSVLDDKTHVKVTISVPEGRKIAEKTFNSRLGIEGGISILGTTGIVKPMSFEALKESIAIEIKQKALKTKKLILAFGNLGEKYAESLGYSKDKIVICSNFIGFALETCVLSGVTDVLVVGHIGKMCKIAYGCFMTHSRVCGIRLEVLALELALLGKDTEFIKKVLNEKTCESAVKLLGDGYYELYKNIGRKIIEKINIYTQNKLSCNIIMYYGSKKQKKLYNSFEDLGENL